MSNISRRKFLKGAGVAALAVAAAGVLAGCSGCGGFRCSGWLLQWGYY
ncbi:MAG: twin-arginine translocation signal domain-containing protein [Faecalibacterium prausnitzii]|nr:twin-arginine translocation signal domain-containing protein [Faecalibacterium prausnitzii]